MQNNKQIKSKERVAEHGEVFTAEREVNAMLDLVKEETERIESRFLEPACGDGNFLVEILRRKLAVVTRRYKNNPSDYEKYAFIALSSIYGVELLSDNAVSCRKRLQTVFAENYRTICQDLYSEEYINAISFLLAKNIICGDALSLKDSKGKAVTFSEWSLVTGNLVKRRDFHLSSLLDSARKQMTLDMIGWEYDDEIKEFIPLPIREFPLIDYRSIHHAG